MAALLYSAWDWTAQKGIVNPIQNQQQCGSCWAFSTVATLESAWAVKTGALAKLSEQVRCAPCSSSSSSRCAGQAASREPEDAHL